MREKREGRARREGAFLSRLKLPFPSLLKRRPCRLISADIRGAGTLDKPLRTSVWEAMQTDTLFGPLSVHIIGV